MMHKAWSSIEEVPYCFARSSVKFQGRTALKIVQFDPDWAFPDCNSSSNSPMATKWCTKLEVALKRCPIVFRGHPSNFTVTQAEKLTIWIQFEITRPVAAIKSLRFALFYEKYDWSSHSMMKCKFKKVNNWTTTTYALMGAFDYTTNGVTMPVQSCMIPWSGQPADMS